MRGVHVAWAWVSIGANGLAGLWAFAAHRYPGLRTKALWWFTAAAQVAVVVQVILGVIYMNTADIEPAEFHMFYGFVGIATVGLTYSYRQQLQQIYLWYGAFGLFIMGLGLRAAFLGPGR